MLRASIYLHSRHNGVTKKVLPEACHTLRAPTHEAQVKNSFNFPGADLATRAEAERDRWMNEKIGAGKEAISKGPTSQSGQ